MKRQVPTLLTEEEAAAKRQKLNEFAERQAMKTTMKVHQVALRIEKNRLMDHLDGLQPPLAIHPGMFGNDESTIESGNESGEEESIDSIDELTQSSGEDLWQSSLYAQINKAKEKQKKTHEEYIQRLLDEKDIQLNDEVKEKYNEMNDSLLLDEEEEKEDQEFVNNFGKTTEELYQDGINIVTKAYQFLINSPKMLERMRLAVKCITDLVLEGEHQRDFVKDFINQQESFINHHQFEQFLKRDFKAHQKLFKHLMEYVDDHFVKEEDIDHKLHSIRGLMINTAHSNARAVENLKEKIASQEISLAAHMQLIQVLNDKMKMIESWQEINLPSKTPQACSL